MAGSSDVAGFIASNFRSVWSLELLLLLRGDERRWSFDELVATLRASDLIVRQGLDALTAAGLVVIDDGGACYRPASAAARASVDETAELYRLSPDAVRRLIVASSVRPLNAFADAFKLRRE